MVSGTNKQGMSLLRRLMTYRRGSIRWLLVFYDVLIWLLSAGILALVFPLPDPVRSVSALTIHFVLLFAFRIIAPVYRQIWRYATAAAFCMLEVVDGLAALIWLIIVRTCLPSALTSYWMLSLCILNLLLALTVRLVYRCTYQHSHSSHPFWRFLCRLLKVFTAIDLSHVRAEVPKQSRIRIAIVGAGSVGVGFASELLTHETANYVPVCFLDRARGKTGRKVLGLPVLQEEEMTRQTIEDRGIQEFVIASQLLSGEELQHLYHFYSGFGIKVVMYNYQNTEALEEGGKHVVRDIDPEDLLFRPRISIERGKLTEYYRDKVILVTGGGGSIGSEICRQLAELSPKQIVIVDEYENGAYEIQQELRMKYGKDFPLAVEILSVCDEVALTRVFERVRPDIVLHAAAHKHVPLMEENPIEAIANNVFGTHTVVSVAEKTGVGRFIMISTDKAVNPTNVMGATKRMDEMIVLNHKGNMHTSATRFGNVLGSAGSVIPLFRRQIQNGGPVTVTDKRIIRYFMTIPEAAGLVLESGVLAKQGELFVLDMGKPVRIMELAENLIRLSGYVPYKDIDIIETGLREGEKLYEELLTSSATLTRTENERIFIEKDAPLSEEEIAQKLSVLRKAVDSGDDMEARRALHEVVPTYREPKKVNAEADKSREMREVDGRTGKKKKVNR